MNNILYWFIGNTDKLLLVLLVLNTILQLKVFKTPFDYDISNHLYFGYLRYNKINFISSYDLGIKYILPRLYTFMMPLIHNRLHFFRLANLVLSNTTITLLFFLKQDLQQIDVLLLFGLVFIINSGYVNSLKSASEFYEGLFLVIIVLIHQNITNEYISVLIMLLLVVSGAMLYKMTFSLYGISIVFLSGIYKENIIVSAIVLIISFTVFFILLRFKNKGKVYNKTRRILNPKNIRYILGNPIFVLSLVALSLYNIYVLPVEYKVLQVISIIILLGQKNYTTHFYYPVTMVSVSLAYISNNLAQIDPIYIQIPVLIFAINSLSILFMSPKTISLFYRMFYMFDFGWKTHLEQTEKAINYLINNTDRSKYFYLWGSNVAILLHAKVKHSPGTFYNHNHLFYWSDIENKTDYAINYLKNNKPKYVIEAMVIEGNTFPQEKFPEYKKIKTIYDTNIYILQN